MKTRIRGFDFARSLAIFGMVLVNFKLVMQAENSNEWLVGIAMMFEGRSAPLFVMLAGVGLSLMSKTDIQANDTALLRRQQKQILKRGVILMLTGVAFLTIWPADILHFYGLYFLFVAFIIHWSTRRLIFVAVLGNFIFLICLFVFDYERGWDWQTIDYLDLWSLAGFIRHWFFNGFHPALVWFTFLLVGVWLGRQPLIHGRFSHQLLGIAVGTWLVVHLISFTGHWWVNTLSASEQGAEALHLIFSVFVMPPLPLYVLSATTSSLIFIILSLELCHKFADSRAIALLVEAGRQSLTIYMAHVLIGMAIMEALGMLEGTTIEWTFIITGLFVISAVVFANLWSRYFELGPFEWVFRKITR
jgi:uncharacterized protein